LHQLEISWATYNESCTSDTPSLLTTWIRRIYIVPIVQHFLLVLSFTALVISGFALSWPESIFAYPFGPGEAIRRIVHRAAALVMIVLGLYHLGYMTLTAEGRRGLRDFWFRRSDARDLADVLRGKHAHIGRFSYAEKAEYWAGLRGTMVMAITGLMIWYFVEVESSFAKNIPPLTKRKGTIND
jgi:cytochrome b subunit of formate dehydrogenase